MWRKVELGTADVRRESRYDGETAISIGIVKQAVANPLDVAIAVNQVLPAINESMPEGTSIEVGFDSTVFIDRSINNVFTTILEATGLVIHHHLPVPALYPGGDHSGRHHPGIAASPPSPSCMRRDSRSIR